MCFTNVQNCFILLSFVDVLEADKLLSCLVHQHTGNKTIELTAQLTATNQMNANVNQNKSEQIRTNQNKSEQIRTNQNKSEQIRANQIQWQDFTFCIVYKKC